MGGMYLQGLVALRQQDYLMEECPAITLNSTLPDFCVLYRFSRPASGLSLYHPEMCSKW
ncbi:MAG: hypothetical protein AAF526_09315 [Pseudomonadota bacterium]